MLLPSCLPGTGGPTSPYGAQPSLADGFASQSIGDGLPIAMSIIFFPKTLRRSARVEHKSWRGPVIAARTGRVSGVGTVGDTLTPNLTPKVVHEHASAGKPAQTVLFAPA